MKIFIQASALALVLVVSGAASSFARPPLPAQANSSRASAESRKRLSADDVTLLLIGGASSQKMIVLIRQRGIDFALNPDLVKQFYQDGATDSVIDALQKASEALQAQSSSAASSPKPASAPSPAAPPPPASAPVASAQPVSTAGEQPATRQPIPRPATPNTQPPAVNQEASTAPLPDPSPARIQQIIQAFAAKEKLFEEARDNYTYRQINKVYEYDAAGQVDGTWEQDWDILFGTNGKRIEQVTYAPESSLKQLTVTEQDIQSFRNIQPFVLTTDSLPDYDVQYLGHVHVDYITCYVFSVRPKEIKKGHLYFKGVVWVDDQALQIVKAEGIMIPQTKDNRFPRFTTWRQQIDGKYWFPTFTMADDTLYFDNGGPPVHIKEIVKYTDYKQFKSNVKILSVKAITPPPDKTTPPPTKH